MSSLWARELRKAGARAALPALVALAAALPPWLADWPTLAQPMGAQGVLRALGVLAGVAGAALWVASLVLMLRFPAFDAHFGGLEQQYFAHHLSGTLAYLMLLAHPLLLAGAAWVASPAAAAALAAPWGQPLSVVTGWLALVGLMVMMFATFFAGMPYARWKRWHAASGIAYLFALAHVVWLMPAAGASSAFSYYGAWLLISAMVAGLVALALRQRLDRGAFAAHRYQVENVAQVSPTTVEATLAPRAGTPPLAYAPGQFVFVAFDAGPSYAGCREYHPFTISSAPGVPAAGRFQVLIKALGDCTTRMQHLAAGATARVQGPYGGLFRSADFARKQVWLGGGIGVTPFLAMAAALPAAAGVDFYYLARDARDTPGLATLREQAAKNPKLKVFAFAANEDAPTVHAAMVAHSAPLAARDIYVCGPPGMLQQWLALFAAAGVPQARIHTERFDFR